ncbi:hypothetical protein CHS0354_022596, partial [Potamilus streckersoni]
MLEASSTDVSGDIIARMSYAIHNWFYYVMDTDSIGEYFQAISIKQLKCIQDLCVLFVTDNIGSDNVVRPRLLGTIYKIKAIGYDKDLCTRKLR